ncbi:MAG: bacteriocin fulvocin C-related protein [Dysgonamonadaceae bacterium]|jgi:hypothetical protein|nr:bacteriocin fulvocin C-related protein [Dysgonamonadaceae bacterium]
MNIRNLFLVMLGILFIACSTDNEEFEFSYDRDIDEWTRKNLTEIRKLTRENYLHIKSADYRSAVYAAFSPEQKRQFWIEKLQETLLLDWNQMEKKHIESVLDFVISTNAFDKGLDKDGEIFFYKWSEFAQEYFNWSDETIFSIIVSRYPMVNKAGDILILENNASALKTRNELAESSKTKRCNCSKLAFCQKKCDSGKKCSDPGNCRKSNGGCGAIGFSDCTGLCG